MKYTNKIAAALMLFLLMVSVGNSKPMPSLSIKMKWQGDLVQDVPMALTLSVFSHVSTDNLEIKLTLPDGVTMLDGSTTVITSIQHSKPIELTYTVQISKEAVGQIKAEARINNTGHSSFFAVTGIEVNPGIGAVSQKISPQKEKKQDFKRTQRDGVWLREYQLP